MNPTTRLQILERLQYDYLRALNLSAKSALLDEAQRVLAVGRKYLIRLCSRPTDSRPTKPRTGRPVRYGTSVKAALKDLWLAMDQPCSKHLKAGLVYWIPSWEQRHGPYGAEIKDLVQRISPAQIDRLLASVKTQYPAKVRPTSVNEVRRQIPIRQGPWEVSVPGWLEADTVFHSGGNPSGSFVRSLCVTDIWSGWTEVRATWNQTHHRVHERLREIECMLPFPLIGFDTDNGSEMINYAILSYLKQRPEPVEITRSRPYHSNDNAHVEQKNRTHIREFIGHDRIDEQALVAPLNQAYEAWCLLRNLYHPSSKLLSKARVGGRLIKRHEKQPQTPCQRLLEHEGLSASRKTQLEKLLETNDPMSLAAKVENNLRAYMRVRIELASKRDGEEWGVAAELVSVATDSGGMGASSLRSATPIPPPSCAPPTNSVPAMNRKRRLTGINQTTKTQQSA